MFDDFYVIAIHYILIERNPIVGLRETGFT